MLELHRDFVNSKFGKQIDYSDFIEVFLQLQHIPSKMRMSRPYMNYLSKMLNYLVSFLIRTEPLQDVDILFMKVAADFEERWAEGKVSGWKENVSVPEQNALIDLEFYGKAEELVEIKDGRNQALTYEEMEVEREESELVPQAESDDEEQQTYNPLKIPMGWDGKPIPHWLYKRHGLGQESQHQNGMRRLGIPNSKDFNEITSIEEARQLWGIIQAKQAVNKWRPELEKEYEDEEASAVCMFRNNYKLGGEKKTWKDLKTYRYVFATALIGAVYTLILIPFAIYYAYTQKSLVRHWLLSEFVFYADKV
nr:splicing factor SF3a60 homolog [Tanacetum cinerariifolium]